MSQQKQNLPLSPQYEQNERLIEAIENLTFSIDCLKNYQPRDYSEFLINIFVALNSINHTLNKAN